MQTVNHDVQRCLTLLRDRIRERGFTQVEVQDKLGWGRSYISQLLTKQKKLRVEQVLLILAVIGIEPTEFFADLYAIPSGHWVRGSRPPQPDPSGAIDRLRHELHSVTELLLEKKLITVEDLSAAVKAASDKDGSGS